MGLKDTLRKAAGLLVELPPEESSPGEPVRATPPPAASRHATSSAASELNDLLAQLEDRGEAGTAKGSVKTVEQIARETSGPSLDQITASSAPSRPLFTGEGLVEFAAVYRQAGITVTPFSAEQMLEMLGSLPQELPLDVKRQTVKVSLNALGKSMGATPETIVSDASRKLAALAAYAERLTSQTAEQIATSELEIAALLAQVEEKRRSIATAREQLARVSEQCVAESDRLDDILEFFSLDVAPSRYAAPGSAKSEEKAVTK